MDQDDSFLARKDALYANEKKLLQVTALVNTYNKTLREGLTTQNTMQNSLLSLFSLTTQPALFKVCSELAAKFEQEQQKVQEYLNKVKRINTPLQENNRAMEKLKKTLEVQNTYWKKYSHYIEKVNKLKMKKLDLLNKGQKESKSQAAQFARNETKLAKAQKEYNTKKEETVEEMKRIQAKQQSLIPSVMKTFFGQLYRLQESHVDYSQVISRDEVESRFQAIIQAEENKEDMASDISNNQKHQMPKESHIQINKKTVTKTQSTKALEQVQPKKDTFNFEGFFDKGSNTNMNSFGDWGSQRKSSSHQKQSTQQQSQQNNVDFNVFVREDRGRPQMKSMVVRPEEKKKRNPFDMFDDLPIQQPKQQNAFQEFNIQQKQKEEELKRERQRQEEENRNREIQQRREREEQQRREREEQQRREREEQQRREREEQQRREREAQQAYEQQQRRHEEEERERHILDKQREYYHQEQQQQQGGMDPWAYESNLEFKHNYYERKAEDKINDLFG